ncbi:hypothetical protein ACEWL3_010080 [Sulfitobacter sp. MF3-043]
MSDGLLATDITASKYHSDVSICGTDVRLCAGSRPENVPLICPSDTARFYAHALRDLIETADTDVNLAVSLLAARLVVLYSAMLSSGTSVAPLAPYAATLLRRLIR